MTGSSYLDDVLILLLAAVVVVSLFQKFRASPILGYLIAGAAIGPHTPGFIVDIEGTKVWGEFGVIFLLFTIGLKMPLQRLQVLKRYVFGLGFAQVMTTGLILAGVALILGLSPEAAIMVASVLALSSTAVSLQVLAERGEIALKFGRVSFAILLFQDFVVVVLLVLLSTLGKPDTSLTQELALASAKAVVVLILIILVGRLLFRPLYRGIARLQNPDLFVAVTLLVILSVSVATNAFGLSMELGAFLAGILLSETEYRHQVEADIQPFYGLFLGLFFMTVGMRINVHVMIHQGPLMGAIVLGMLLIKALILFALCRIFHLSKASSLRVSLLLAPGGEFAFVLLAPALQKGLLTEGAGQMLYSAVAISMALTPVLAFIGKKWSDWWLEKDAEKSVQLAPEEVGDLKNHVIVGGFGRVGRMVCQVLGERMIPFVAIDNDMVRVSEGRAQGYPVYYGDARRAVVMRTLGAERAKAAVLSLNHEKASLQSTLGLRREFPHIKVSVRMRDNKYYQKLHQAGAKVIMPENLEPSLQITASVLKDIGMTKNEISQVIEDCRKSYQSNTKTSPSLSEDPFLEEGGG